MQFFKKPKLWRLAVLLTILAVCLLALQDKRRVEAAKVADSSELETAIWALSALLPPGDGDPALTSRLLKADLPGLGPVEAELSFDDALNPWPGRVRLKAGGPSPQALEIEISTPFSRPALVSKPRGKPSPELLPQAVSILKALTFHLEKSWPRFEAFQWQTLEPGLETAGLNLRYGMRMGNRELRLIKMDPARFDFKPWHERELGIQKERDGLDIKGWSEKLPAARVLINGGQYYQDRSYIGLLSRDGRPLAAKRHRSWKGFFLSGPQDSAPAGAPQAAVLDAELKQPPIRPEDYQNVMQSLMLLDERGRIRVNNSFYLASRAAVAQDADGFIYFIMCSGAISLHDLAVILKDPALKLRRALCLDGGFEAQIFWRPSGGPPEMIKAEYLVFPTETIRLQMYRTLPSIIAALPVSVSED